MNVRPALFQERLLILIATPQHVCESESFLSKLFALRGLLMITFIFYCCDNSFAIKLLLKSPQSLLYRFPLAGSYFNVCYFFVGPLYSSFFSVCHILRLENYNLSKFNM